MKIKCTFMNGYEAAEKKLRVLGYLSEEPHTTDAAFFKGVISEMRTQVPAMFPGETVTMLWSQTEIKGESSGDVTRRKVSMFTLPSGGTWACESLVTYSSRTAFVRAKVHCVKLDTDEF